VKLGTYVHIIILGRVADMSSGSGQNYNDHPKVSLWGRASVPR